MTMTLRYYFEDARGREEEHEYEVEITADVLKEFYMGESEENTKADIIEYLKNIDEYEEFMEWGDFESDSDISIDDLFEYTLDNYLYEEDEAFEEWLKNEYEDEARDDFDFWKKDTEEMETMYEALRKADI